MDTSDKFSLRWNDFKENINTAFVSLRKDTQFTDVTLACEDGQQVAAHKVILASSSPFFLNMLTKNRHAHPLIYMRGMKSEDLVAIVDFLYYGEANIYQENLDTFFYIAEELQLKGLNAESRGDEDPSEQSAKPTTLINAPPKKKGTYQAMKPAQIDPINSEFIVQSSSMAIALSKHEFSGNMKKLDEQIETLMGRGDTMVKGNRMRNGEWYMMKAYTCQVCGKVGPRSNIKSHIEANHIEGIIIPCNLCKKTFRSRNSLTQHNYVHHPNANT